MQFTTSKVRDKMFFKQVRAICKEFLPLTLTEIERIHKPTNKNLFILNFGLEKKLRLECISPKKYIAVAELRHLLEDNNINVSKLFSYTHKTNKGALIVISEWIYGEEFHLKLKSKSLSKESRENLFIDYGDLLGKMNSIKVDDLHVLNSDIGLPNIIVTEENKLFIIDHQKLKLVSDARRVSEIVKLVLKRIKLRSRIDYFLIGYGRYFDTKDIIQRCEDHNWLWWGKKKI
jgi:hypothetical protein